MMHRKIKPPCLPTAAQAEDDALEAARPDCTIKPPRIATLAEREAVYHLAAAAQHEAWARAWLRLARRVEEGKR